MDHQETKALGLADLMQALGTPMESLQTTPPTHTHPEPEPDTEPTAAPQPEPEKEEHATEEDDGTDVGDAEDIDTISKAC